MTDEPLKSSYELAMERLRARDREQGLDEGAPLSREQKEHIAGLRVQAQAKRAEIEILSRDRLAEARADPDKLRLAREHQATDLRRVDAWLESAIAEVKQAKPAKPAKPGKPR